MWKRLVIAIIGSITIIYLSTTIFTFFDVSLQSYLIYVMFIVAILFLFALLPYKTHDFFKA